MASIDGLDVNPDFIYTQYDVPEFEIPISQTISGSGTPVLTINGVVTGPAVTLSGGTSGFSYSASGTTTLNLVSPITTKGDIYTWSSSGTRLAVGSNGQVLTADSAQTTGLKWAAVGAASFGNQTANTGLFGPTSGGAATPTFRALVDADLPQTAWASWTPSWTNLTVGNGTVVAKYAQLSDKMVVARVSLVFGTTTSVSGTVQVSLPVTSVSYAGSAAAQPIGLLIALDLGVNQYEGMMVWGSTTSAYFFVVDTSGTYGVQKVVNATVPFTWGTSDEMNFQMYYEAA